MVAEMGDAPSRTSRRAWIPNAVTAIGLCCGFAAILATTGGELDLAVYLLFAAVLLDMIDGRVARLLGVTSRFGQQLDSLADLTSFGVAPALLIYQAVLHELGGLGLAVALVYLLAGWYRLARFNVEADAHRKAARTTGLPIPIAAGNLMAAALLRDQLDAGWWAVLVLWMSAMMISRWRLPTVVGTDWVSLLLLINIANYAVLLVRPSLWTGAWWFGWMWMAVLLAAIRDHRRAAELSASCS